MSSDNRVGAPIQSLQSAAGEANAQAFLFQAMMAGIATSTLGVVRAVYPGGIAGASFVDIQPLVGQVDGDGTVTPHGTINHIPVHRPQAGGSALILDPKVGDIGICVFASRDISVVKATRRPSQPGSARRYDMADGLYIGGVLNGPVTEYVEMGTADGIKITSTTKVTIEAPTVTVLGDLTASGRITAGYGSAGQVGLQTHTHPGNGAPPAPGS